MGGHGHGEPPYRVPPASEFQIKGIPQLEELEKALALKGLKDPWIRNEAWRYNPGFGTRGARARALFFRGAPAGLGLAIIATVIGNVMSSDSHGHSAH